MAENKETMNEENQEETVEVDTTESVEEEVVENETTSEEEDKDSSENDSEPKKDKKDLKIEELNDRYIRTMAEFDNYRKRTDKEKSAMYEIGARDVIEKILPVVDNFERGLKAMTKEEKESNVGDGMDRIYKQILQVFESIGVKEIEAVGKEFDPALHNAVMHVEDEAFGENEICEEFQKGYTYRDSVVRHSMVKVAN